MINTVRLRSLLGWLGMLLPWIVLILSLAFGFSFPENFNYPYISKSITEFWRRWHMSLGTWFRDYIYIPLGGNRTSKIKWLKNKNY